MPRSRLLMIHLKNINLVWSLSILPHLALENTKGARVDLDIDQIQFGPHFPLFNFIGMRRPDCDAENVLSQRAVMFCMPNLIVEEIRVRGVVCYVNF